MTFNITVVAFDKEPDLSEEKILTYRGFDAALVGKETQGTAHMYSVKSSVKGVCIEHVEVRDEKVDSPNMILVIENIPLDLGSSELQDKIREILTETMYRLDYPNAEQVEGPYFVEGVMAWCFLNVRSALSEDLSRANRSSIIAAK